MLTATFDLTGVNQGDVGAVEAAWNKWADELRVAGFEPADEPIRWTETTQTFRVHMLDLRSAEHALDFGVHA